MQESEYIKKNFKEYFKENYEGKIFDTSNIMNICEEFYNAGCSLRQVMNEMDNEDEAFNNGHDSGYQEGYDDGFDAGYDQALLDNNIKTDKTKE